MEVQLHYDNLIDDVLTLWFGHKPYEAKSFWFASTSEFDANLALKFGEAYDSARDGELDHLAETAEGTLTLIILLDQCPRNMFRDDPRAFHTDHKALSFAKHAVAKKFDQKLDRLQRVFVYLPFEHSEDLADQEQSLALFKPMDGYYDYAVRHYDIIKEYGRFPHRNPVLGRRSTEAESTFLTQPNPFG
jgi:uncharacterized protein (DUF924 family)